VKRFCLPPLRSSLAPIFKDLTPKAASLPLPPGVECGPGCFKLSIRPSQFYRLGFCFHCTYQNNECYAGKLIFCGFGELLQRMDDSNAKYNIALPELPQFRNLWLKLRD
jgi:hypothetical protein